MFETKHIVDIHAPELAAAIAALANALQNQNAARPVWDDSLVVETKPIPTAQQAPMQQPTTPASASPMTPPPMQAPVIPTAPIAQPAAAPLAAAPAFTHEQIAKAGGDMARDNPNAMPALLSLLQQFGVQAITELKPDQLGAFATALRGLGAKL